MSYPVIDPIATGNRINDIRKNMGYSVAYLRDYLGFATTNAVYKWLNGQSMPTLDNMLALSILFGLTINDIIVYTNAEI